MNIMKIFQKKTVIETSISLEITSKKSYKMIKLIPTIRKRNLRDCSELGGVNM